MERTGFSSQGVVRFRASSSQDDQHSIGFEEFVAASQSAEVSSRVNPWRFPAMRFGLSPTAIPSALTERSDHLEGR